MSPRQTIEIFVISQSPSLSLHLIFSHLLHPFFFLITSGSRTRHSPTSPSPTTDASGLGSCRSFASVRWLPHTAAATSTWQPRIPNPGTLTPNPRQNWRWGWRKIWVRRGSISHRLTKNLKLNQLTRSKSVCVNIYALVSTMELNY